MDWMKIGSALLLVMFLIYLFPQAKHMIKNSRKGTQQEWMGAVMLLGGVALFVLLLMKMV